MIKATNLSYSIPEKDLYNKVSFEINQGDICAFIGACGSGKSTMAKIFMDPEEYMYDGKLEIDENCKMVYVSQFYDVDSETSCTVFDYIAQEFTKLNDKIGDLCTKMGEVEDLEDIFEEYQLALDEFEAVDGDNYESNINKKLNLADMSKLRDMDISKLSGGEFKLVQVIKQMLMKPNFIIMDEPDSFLDFENLNSLKNLINGYKGTMLVITHSRYLLNHCFNKILHLEGTQIQEFEGRYIDYNFALLEGKIDMKEQALADSEEMIRNEALIDRMRIRASFDDNEANGRKLNARVKIQERLEANRVKDPFICIEKPNINLVANDVIADEIILSVKDLEVAFEEAGEKKVLIENATFEVNSTDKVAIIGANGVGKTSLMRVICQGNNEKIEISENATISYLSQNQNDVLDDYKTIYDEFFDVGMESYDAIDGYLSKFGFSKEKMEQRIGLLSGGEKNILSLAKVCRLKSNFFILDEPTSHLDTYGQIALEEAINRYNGAILMISHDFYSIVNCMDYLLIVEEKTVKKIDMKQFKRMIYQKHFTKDYLVLEQRKKEVEVKIEKALTVNNFVTARAQLRDLEKIIAKM